MAASGCLLHAYVQMTNHVHLLLTPPAPDAVSQLVISLGRRYVQYINKSYRRTGTLWDSRYKSSLVQADTYLLLCQRYIELNPVRAAMVDDPAHYRWSSYRANGLGQADPLLTPHPVYAGLGARQADRLAAYRALFSRPKLLLCDEPTGNLDSATGHEVIEFFQKINKDDGVTLVIVTHERRVSNIAQRVIAMRDGNIVEGAGTDVHTAGTGDDLGGPA